MLACPTPNEGALDRIVRAVLGITVIAAAWLSLAGTWQIITGVVGIVIFLTGVVGYCHLYTLLGISTVKRR
jgi:hypothetical protein